MGGGTTNNLHYNELRHARREPGSEQLLVILLVKLAVAASLASILTRSQRFPAHAACAKNGRSRSASRWRVGLRRRSSARASATRVLTHGAYSAVDLGLEGSLVMGMLGGYVTGTVLGRADLHPGDVQRRICHAAAGRGRRAGRPAARRAPDKEAIWKFSPFPDLSLCTADSQAATCGCPPSACSACWRFCLSELLRSAMAPAFFRTARRLRAPAAMGASVALDCRPLSTPPLCSPPCCRSRSGTATATRRSWSSSSCG